FLLLIICPVAATAIRSERLWLRGLILQKRQQKKNIVAKSIAQATDTYKSPTCFCVVIWWMIQITSPQSKLVGRAQGLYGSACQHQLAIIILLGNNRSIIPVRKMPIDCNTSEFLLTGGYAIAQMHRPDFKSGDAIVGCNVIVDY
ncbi:hypothetical protein CUMW_228690, partial [Citrus unshiu]